ncbi:hypothetical protein ACFOOM_17020 [Streptomyces echinoruber]|uniref:BACON domain-containing protein n=1 Tax=Streptomyces echinoruber TaxID=68898 RepID=A0A918R2L5_9ACTN|nr:hypothetical protein [Streptomyces echinoruber]GGZ85097.1 hypothetical protein GCM10010389_24100 [Streptomyces echinoruber]
MTSSSTETSTRTTGTHRAHRAHREARDRAAARTLAQRPPARYEPYLDGLFTYCLSVLCDHDAATAALGDVLALAERRGARAPEAAGEHRAWLYALARWACLRELAEARRKRRATHAAGRPGAAGHDGPRPGEVPAGAQEQERRRRELAELAWPEAAGTTPEQREALELAVRHHLSAQEVAAVLGRDLAATRDLLASAACEVERTRAALAVVELGGCPGVAHLAGDHRLVLSPALRRELVRHVDDCPRCRRTAERAVPGRWPGTSVTPAELPVLEAPRAALHAAMAHPTRARGTAPRFDRRGFPMDPKDRAARRDRMRARAVTTTVVATVVAAPVLALWAAYRGTPAGEANGHPATASEAHDPGALGGETAGGYENTGDARTRPGARTDVSVEVVGVSGRGEKGAGRLTVTAAQSGGTTLITLTAYGPSPVRWSASTTAPWLDLSRSSGTLRPGETFTVEVYVDHLREPTGRWSARVAVSPAGAVVTIEGHGPEPARPSRPRPAGPGGLPAPSDRDDRGPVPTASAPAPADPSPGGPPPGSGEQGEPSRSPESGPPSPSGPPSASPGDPTEPAAGGGDSGPAASSHP